MEDSKCNDGMIFCLNECILVGSGKGAGEGWWIDARHATRNTHANSLLPALREPLQNF